MLALLSRRYTESAGNGDAWAFIPKVRNKAGFSATRTLDAVAMSLWPSRGLTLHGFEIKCSRSDWLREMRDPAKADAFGFALDKFWLVVANSKIVLAGELPETWGLLVVEGSRLVCRKEAPDLPVAPKGSVEPFSSDGRHFLAALLRAAIKELRASVDVEQTVKDAVDAERRRGEVTLRLEREERERLEQRERAMAKALGFNPLELRWQGEEKLISAFRTAMSGEDAVGDLKRRLEQLALQADRIAALARGVAEPSGDIAF